METTVEIVNTDQAAAWDGHEGDVWTEQADRYDAAGERILKRFFEAEIVETSDDVLDVGCGTGRLARDVARLASQGTVVGIDLSAKMLGLARERAAAENLTNVSFIQGDVQVHRFEPAVFDVAISSFGAMFFNDPVAAFSNIASALRPGGRLALLAWRELQRNDWLVELRAALAMGRDLPVPPPDAPTPFSLADQDRVRRLLDQAGYRDVAFQAIDEHMNLGATVEDAFAFAQTMGIVEGLSNGLDDAQRAQAMDNIKTMLAAHETSDGVMIGTSAWLITAVRA